MRTDDEDQLVLRERNGRKPTLIQRNPDVTSTARLPRKMTRAKRFVGYSAVLTTLYLLAFFSIVPVPLLEEETTQQLLPVVRLRS
jgi:hypothetical protein